MEATTFLYTFLLTTFLIYTALLLLRKRRTPPLPPGPTGLPLVGSLPFLEPQLHKYFADLSKKYGPICSLRLGTKLAVVISSKSLARAVLREHDNTFANRDVPASARVLTYGGSDVVWTPNGPTWRMLRRICVHEILSPQSLNAVSSLREQEIRSTVHHIHARSDTPVDIGIEMFLNVLNVLTNTMWGNTLDEDKGRESVGKDFKELVANMTDLLGRPNASDFFPALARFDLQGIQSKMEVLKERFDKIFERIIEKKSFNEGERPKDFVEIMLRMEREGGDSKTPFTRDHLKGLLMVGTTKVLSFIHLISFCLSKST